MIKKTNITVFITHTPFILSLNIRYEIIIMDNKKEYSIELRIAFNHNKQ